MALAIFPKIDFGSRATVIRSVCLQLGLPQTQVPSRNIDNSRRQYLRYINFCRTAVSLPLYVSMDYSKFTSAINEIAAAAGSAKAENIVAPNVTGLTTLGATLTCSTGTWLNSGGATYTYQWMRLGVAIGGATASTYVIVSGDQGGKGLMCQVTATTAAGASTPTNSNTVQVP